MKGGRNSGPESYSRQKVSLGRLIQLLKLLILILAAPLQLNAQVTITYSFITLAGNAGHGIADGAGSQARFDQPSGIAVDRMTNAYVADTYNHTIRKITPDGVVTTLAGFPGSPGTNDGAGSAARFLYPAAVAVDASNNLYVADTSNHSIRKITPAGEVTTLAGTPGTAGTNDGPSSTAQFNYPYGLAVNGDGTIFVADSYNHTIRKITPDRWVSTLAGSAGVLGTSDGTGSNARFFYPYGVAVDDANNVYVADRDSCAIRQVTPGGVVSTLVGQFIGSVDGTGVVARLYYPSSVALDSSGNLYVADSYNHTIRYVTVAGTNSFITTLAGWPGSTGSSNGFGAAARFKYPNSVALGPAGNVFVADLGNHLVRMMSPAGAVTTIAGESGGADFVDGMNSAARFSRPADVAVDGDGNVLVADSQNNAIRKITPGGLVTTLAGLVGTWGGTDGLGTNARFNSPYGITVDRAGNAYVSDSQNHTIRKVTPSGLVTTVAGLAGVYGSADGTGTNARFYYPWGLSMDASGTLDVAEIYKPTRRQIRMEGPLTTLAGMAGARGTNDGLVLLAHFYLPREVAVDSAGTVYVADSNNHTIRKIQAGTVSTLAGLAGKYGTSDGTGIAARFAWPRGVCVDSATNVYVADSNNQAIRKVTPDGVVTTVAGVTGSFSFGTVDGTGSAARFYDPNAVKFDQSGNLYVADYDNNTIRKGIPTASVPALTLQQPNLAPTRFGFTILGMPGLATDIEVSTSWPQWRWVGTCVLENGSNTFVSPIAPQTFELYRAKLR